MEGLTEDDLKVFLNGLQNGLNFTECCNLIMQHPREMSTFVKGNTVMHAKCKQALKLHKQFLLQHATKYANSKRVVSWAKTIHRLKKTPDKLYMWEDYCKRKDLTPLIFLNAQKVINDSEQTATACGMTYEELQEFINEHKELSIYLAYNE